MKTKDGEDWQASDEDVLAWQQAYKAIDVFTELDAMACWLEANPAKRKTSRGMKRFVNAWLNRANKTGGSPQQYREPVAEGEPMPLKKWSMVDMLTHDFMNSEKMRQKWLAEHGQYVDSKGVRHVE